jgi:O-antigen/teichoic acid export membrane protein
MGYIPNLLAMRVNDSIGKLFVTQKFDLVSTGIYSLGQKLGMVVNVYSMSFISAYRPWLFKKLSAVDCLDKRKIALSIAFAYISITLFAFAGSLCVYFLSDIFLGKNFKGALAYVLWSASAYAINGLYGIIAQFIYYTGKSWILSFHTIFATCLNAFLTFLFLNKFGMIGAAYAPTIAWTATLILAVFVTLKLWKNRLSQPESHSKTLEL